MSWTKSEAHALGLKTVGDYFAYFNDKDWYIDGIEVVIDQRVVAESGVSAIEEMIKNKDLRFDTLQECLIYLRLRA